MDSTRAVELALLGAQQLGQFEQRFERHHGPLRQRSTGDLDHVDRRLATDPTARRGEHVALQRGRVERFSQPHRQHVVLLLRVLHIGAVADISDLAPIDHEAFSQQKPGGEFEVGARRSHRHGHLCRFLTRAANTNLERFLASHAIAFFDRTFAAGKAQHADVGGRSCKRWAVGDVDD